MRKGESYGGAVAALRPDGTAGARATGRPFWLGTDPESVYTVLHTPAAGVRTRFAALLLPTFGWDNDFCYRPRRDWATKLAEAGVTAARIDFPGSENSVGSPLSTNRLQSWVDATSQAARWLRELTGCERLVVIGVGLGGYVGYKAIAANAPIDDLVLWGVRANGRPYLREMRIFAASMGVDMGDTRDDDRADGATSIGGHVMSKETAEALSAINLTEIPLPQAAQRRVLLIGRDAHGVDAKLKTHLEQSGAELTVIEADDYLALMSQPDLGITPAKTISASIKWIQDSESAPKDPIQHPPSASPPDLSQSIEFEYQGQRIRERIIELETDSGRMVGIISEPSGGERAPYCLVAVNSGALRHTGPNRMFVEINRRAAADGVPAARFDLTGLGDSDGRLITNPQRRATNDVDALAALRTLYDYLEHLGVAAHFVAGGLCLGASLPLRAVLQEKRLIGTISANPPAFWQSAAAHEQIEGLVSPSGAATVVSAETLEAVATAGAEPGQIERLRSAIEARLRARLAHVGFLWRLEHRKETADVASTLDQIGDTGVPVLLLLAENENVRRTLIQPKLATKLERLPNITVEHLPTTDHNLGPIWIQEMVFDRVSLALRELRSDARLQAISKEA